ncbi:MAG: hypothetical protein ACTSU2_06845 [Promethearchaeota archaeon]
MPKKKKDSKDSGSSRNKKIDLKKLEKISNILEDGEFNISIKLPKIELKQDKAQKVPVLEVHNDPEGAIEDTTGSVLETPGLKTTPSFLQKAGTEAPKSRINPLTMKPEEIIASAAAAEETGTPSEGQAPSGPIEEDEHLAEFSEDSIYREIYIFLKDLVDSYRERYDLWEESTNSILSILKQLNNINEKNSEILNNELELAHKKLKEGILRFKTKREYIEKYSDVDYSETLKALKKTLELLALQLKEAKLKNLLYQLIKIYS